MDGLPFFLESSWASIRSNKELNLPDQRKLVAEYRCNELKDEVIKNMEGDISKLEKDAGGEYMEDFK